jgi:beta-glucanase (GH16 family)
VETKPAYNTQYGYIEARISLPYGRGFWPAIWTFVGEGLPTHTNAAEIDIFEMYGHKPATNLETNVHLEYCNPDRFDYPGCPSIPSYHKSHLIPSYANKYHVYGCEWTPEFLKFKFNGVAIRVMNNPGVIDPVRIIMNMAILVGDPPTQFTPFPSDIKIDYVRVYEQVQSTGVPISEKSDEISVYPNPANHFITIQLADLRDVEIEGVEVVNMFGQTVKSVREISDTVMDLDIDDLEKGMYQIIIQTNKGSLVKTFSKM